MSSRTSSVSLSYQAESREDVDDVLCLAVAADGSIPSTSQSHDWGYNGYFKGPDGHFWEVAYFESEE